MQSVLHCQLMSGSPRIRCHLSLNGLLFSFQRFALPPLSPSVCVGVRILKGSVFFAGISGGGENLYTCSNLLSAICLWLMILKMNLLRWYSLVFASMSL